jgi:hypothetical protein
VTLLAAALAACVPLAPAEQPAQQPVQTAPEEARTVIMIVGPELVDCVGVGPQKCYQVKTQPGDEYQLFYSPIQGFEYEPGYEYQITVKVETVDNPPADASAHSYTLVEVISKTPVSQSGGEPEETPTPSVEPAAATPESQPAAAAGDWTAILKNLSYQSYITQSGMAPLVDGEYREPAAPDSAAEIVVLLTDFAATGDLNGDGAPDAAVALATNSGGSGVFYDLAAVVVEDGRPVNVAIMPLGDRVQINSLTIQDGQIMVDMVTQGPDDPMCCPTQPVVEIYALQGYELVKIQN